MRKRGPSTCRSLKDITISTSASVNGNSWHIAQSTSPPSRKRWNISATEFHSSPCLSTLTFIRNAKLALNCIPCGHLHSLLPLASDNSRPFCLGVYYDVLWIAPSQLQSELGKASLLRSSRMSYYGCWCVCPFSIRDSVVERQSTCAMHLDRRFVYTTVKFFVLKIFFFGSLATTQFGKDLFVSRGIR
jgi:hypothetical protein